MQINNGAEPPPRKNDDIGKPYLQAVPAQIDSDDSLKPWWQSKTILALIATLIIYASSKLGILPPEITHEDVTSFLIVAAPIAVAIWGRLNATKSLAPPPSALPDLYAPFGLMRVADTRPKNTWREFLAIAITTAAIVALLYVLFG